MFKWLKRCFSVNKSKNPDSLFGTSDIAWIDEFNIQMGLKHTTLFSIQNMDDAFLEAPRRLKVFYTMIETDQASSGHNLSLEKRQQRIRNSMKDCTDREREMLLDYWEFFGELLSRIHSHPNLLPRSPIFLKTIFPQCQEYTRTRF